MCDYFDEYNELLYYFTGHHAYQIICKILPIRKVFVEIQMVV